MGTLFPNGMTHYLLGGALIGAAVGIVYFMTGRIAGVSSVLSAWQSLWSRRLFFRQQALLEDRRWKSVLVVGLLLGAALSTLSTGWYVTTVQPWRLALGGFFVGYGTRLGRGCTSGHGVCGISAASKASIASTITFVGMAVLVANLVRLAGVTP